MQAALIWAATQIPSGHFAQLGGFLNKMDQSTGHPENKRGVSGHERKCVDFEPCCSADLLRAQKAVQHLESVTP